MFLPAGIMAVGLLASTMYGYHAIIRFLKTSYVTLMCARADLEAGTVQKEEAVAQGPAAVYHRASGGDMPVCFVLGLMHGCAVCPLSAVVFHIC